MTSILSGMHDGVPAGVTLECYMYIDDWMCLYMSCESHAIHRCMQSCKQLVVMDLMTNHFNLYI